MAAWEVQFVRAIRILPVIRTAAPELQADSKFRLVQELDQQFELHPAKAVEVVWNRLGH